MFIEIPVAQEKLTVRSRVNLQRSFEFPDEGHTQSVRDPTRKLLRDTTRSGKCDKNLANFPQRSSIGTELSVQCSSVREHAWEHMQTSCKFNSPVNSQNNTTCKFQQIGYKQQGHQVEAFFKAFSVASFFKAFSVASFFKAFSVASFFKAFSVASFFKAFSVSQYLLFNLV